MLNFGSDSQIAVTDRGSPVFLWKIFIPITLSDVEQNAGEQLQLMLLILKQSITQGRKRSNAWSEFFQLRRKEGRENVKVHASEYSCAKPESCAFQNRTL